ncbi:MAG: AtpZ/AtpI family protein [Rubrivivax sp.]
MNDPGSDSDKRLAEQVGAKAARKLQARRDGAPGVWSGLGMMGLIGWSVVVPTLAGAGLGIWLDAAYPGAHRWSLALLMAGLVLGCLNAWRWVAQQDRAMHAANRGDDRSGDDKSES